MADLNKVQDFTRQFSTLQGLKTIPFGLYMVLLSTRYLGWTWLGKDGDLSLNCLLFILMIAAVFAISRYYASRFGKVEPVSSPRKTLETAGIIILLLSAFVLDIWMMPPVSLLAVTIAVVMVISAWVTRRYYYAPIGIVIGIAGFLPAILRVPLSDPIFGSLGFVMSNVIGWGVVIAGVVDHFRLVRTLHEISSSEAMEGSHE